MAAFDLQMAGLTVYLSRVAYRDAARAEADAAARGLGEFRFFSGPSTQAFTATNVGRRFLAFRGTESRNPVDWVKDAQFRPRATPLGRVHTGFDSALDEVWDEIRDEIENDTRPLTITGHSLGGGLSIVAAARLVALTDHPASVYVYGCPRVGLRDFRDAYDAALHDVTFRVINHIDLVTRVPFLALGYRAPGRRIYFDAAGTFHADAGAWHIARDDLQYRFTHFGRISSLGLGNHEIGAYVDRIDSLG